MKLTGQKAANFLNAPPSDIGGILLYGADASRVGLKRQAVIDKIIGKDGRDEMRFNAIDAQTLLKDPACLHDALHARGFFEGAQVVFVESASDQHSKTIANALESWAKGDAFLVVSAGSLRTSSSLRKLFEKNAHSVAIGIYDDPPTRHEITHALKNAGIENITQEALDNIVALAAELGPGNSAQFIEKLALYRLDAPDAPISLEDVAACLPETMDAAVSDLIHAIAEADIKSVTTLFQSLKGQGTNATLLCIMAGRHFHTLHRIASAPNGVDDGLAQLRPPVFGPLRTRLSRQAKRWNIKAIETALSTIATTDIALRSGGQTAPAMALVERAFLRIALIARA